jgi:hypothetical protein
MRLRLCPSLSPSGKSSQIDQSLVDSLPLLESLFAACSRSPSMLEFPVEIAAWALGTPSRPSFFRFTAIFWLFYFLTTDEKVRTRRQPRWATLDVVDDACVHTHAWTHPLDMSCFLILFGTGMFFSLFPKHCHFAALDPHFHIRPNVRGRKPFSVFFRCDTRAATARARRTRGSRRILNSIVFWQCRWK